MILSDRIGIVSFSQIPCRIPMICDPSLRIASTLSHLSSVASTVRSVSISRATIKPSSFLRRHSELVKLSSTLSVDALSWFAWASLRKPEVGMQRLVIFSRTFFWISGAMAKSSWVVRVTVLERDHSTTASTIFWSSIGAMYRNCWFEFIG